MPGYWTADTGRFLSAGETTTHVLGRAFTLTGITHQGWVTFGESDFPPSAGRHYVRVCGAVTSPDDAEVDFRPGIDNNLVTGRGMGFRVPDDNVTDWSEVGAVLAGETSSGCDVWEVPAGAGTVFYAVNNWLEHPAVYRVELFPEVTDIGAIEQE